MDGVISAALIMRFLVRDSLYSLRPVKSSQRGNKFNKMVDELRARRPNDFIIIVDYQQHPKADLWVDHHHDRDLGNNVVSNGKIWYDSSKKSAARIIFDKLSVFGFNGYRFVNPHIIDMVDMIDSAGYPSVNYIFQSTDYLMILKAYMEQLSIYVESTYCRLVEVINASGFNMDEAIFKLGIDGKIVSGLKDSAELIKKAMTTNGCVSIVEMNRLYAYPRYSEYLANSDVKYAIRIIHLGGSMVQSDVGFNQWGNFTNDVHIGITLGALKYVKSGGGHHDVGGTIMKENDVEQFLDDITSILNGEEIMKEPGIEKVGVDVENDPVEKIAQDMVKTGEINNINDARKKASDEKETDKEDV